METMTPQNQWLLQKERVLAWFRVGFAFVAIIVIQFNPARVSRFPLLSYVCLGAFLIYSLIVLYCILRKQASFRRIGLIATGFDLLWVSLIVYSTGGSGTPFFVYYLFPIVTASTRYGVKGGLAAAVAGLTVYGYIRFNFDWEDSLDIDRFVVRSIYLFVLAYFFGFLSEFETKQNEKLLALSKTAVEAAALQERRRITYELHDGILQSLATLILRLEGCRGQLLPSQKELAEDIGSMEEFTRSSMTEIRQFLAGKESQPLVAGTLVEKLRDELRFLNQGLGLEVILESEPEDSKLPLDIEREAYYVLKEGLTNVTKHSHASRAEIHLRQTDGSFEGTLRDNGVGFNPNVNGSYSGLGLGVMRERIKKSGGELAVESSPGFGTKIFFRVPLVDDLQSKTDNSQTV
jgi:signal transduction histidine kinase